MFPMAVDSSEPIDDSGTSQTGAEPRAVDNPGQTLLAPVALALLAGGRRRRNSAAIRAVRKPLLTSLAVISAVSVLILLLGPIAWWATPASTSKARRRPTHGTVPGKSYLRL